MTWKWLLLGAAAILASLFIAYGALKAVNGILREAEELLWRLKGD